MHEIVDFLKKAVGEGDNVYSCYVVRDGVIYARNEGLQAGVPMASEVPFNIPAAELNRALARMKDIGELKIGDGVLKLRSGRLSATIKFNDEEAQPMPVLPKKWLPVAPGLCEALRMANDFTEDDASRWTHCVRIWKDRVTAFMGQRGIDITIDGLKVPTPLLLPRGSVAYLTEQGDPDGMHIEESAVIFHWDDGRFVRCQFYNSAMPDQVEKLLANAGDKAPVEIDEEWREAFKDVAELSSTNIFRLTNKALHVQSDKAEATVEHTTKGLKKDHTTFWDTRVAEPVFKHATSWAPDMYPDPVLFKGPGFRGVVMGRSTW